MYSKKPGVIFGFHGCDLSITQDILLGKSELTPSTNKYDWLGHGIYFWENSPSRALEYANSLKKYPNRATKPVKDPAIIGAVIDLGFCLDLLDYANLEEVKWAYHTLVHFCETLGVQLPENRNVGNNKDLWLRERDCAVIQSLHQVRKTQNLREFDSVRAVFIEGEPLYQNAGFRSKNHIQLCIRNPNCIKAYFTPRTTNTKFQKV